MANSPRTNEALLRAQEFVRLGILEAAEAACREALLFAPSEAAPWSLLATVLSRQGRAPEAESSARQAVALDASNAEHWRCLAIALNRQSRWAEAAEAFRQSLVRNPADAATWNNLGAMAQRLDQPAAAVEAYERCLALAPQHLGAMSNLAHLLLHRGQRQRGMSLLSSIVAQEPQTADEWVVLGNAWEELGKVPQATAAYRQALSLAPRHSVARHKLAPLLEQQWLLSEAEATARQVATDEPHSADAWNALGRILVREGQIEPAMAAFQQSLNFALHPERHSDLLQCLQYADNVTPQQLLDVHCKWEAAHARAGAKSAAPRPRFNSPLRLGLVSANFHRHPVAFLLLRALECLDSKKCVVVCYADQSREDEFTARFRNAASVWRTVHGLSADELAECIQDDQIDILVDLMGHTGNRLLVFARKPAPVQVTWLGYVGTTGLEAMDYLLADRFHVRPGEEEYYTEKVLRMPNGYACYGPPEEAPEVGPLPALRPRNATEGVPYSARTVTFGCFNNPAKYAPSILDAWAEILLRVPGAQLLLKYGGLDDPQMQERLRGEFTRRGVEVERIALEGWSPHRELLAAYNRVDLALDTQPYSGGLTTCEALWMGVPVITFPGKTFAGRHSVSHLTNACYPQFIATDAAGYVDLVVQWADRLDELAVIRSQMREQVRKSPLCDAPRFAHDFLAVLREAWEAQTRGGKS